MTTRNHCKTCYNRHLFKVVISL